MHQHNVEIEAKEPLLKEMNQGARQRPSEGYGALSESQSPRDHFPMRKSL